MVVSDGFAPCLSTLLGAYPLTGVCSRENSNGS